MNARSLREKYYLIGYASNQLTGSKLPSKKEVIKVLFFNWRVVNMSLRESAKLVIEELLIFWDKARIPTREKQHCIAKLEKLHTEWTNLKKSCGRNTDNQKNKEKTWVESLEQIFDVAHANALELITVEEDKAFLISQRQDGRTGHMYGIDYKTLQMEIQAEHREQIKLKRVERNKREQNIISKINNELRLLMNFSIIEVIFFMFKVKPCNFSHHLKVIKVFKPQSPMMKLLKFAQKMQE